jgi:hypothetical protein
LDPPLTIPTLQAPHPPMEQPEQRLRMTRMDLPEPLRIPRPAQGPHPHTIRIM